MMFQFAYPLLLFLLLPVAGWLVFALRKKPLGLTHSMTSLMVPMAGGRAGLLMRLPIILKACILVLLAITAARPQLYNVSRDVLSPGCGYRSLPRYFRVHAGPGFYPGRGPCIQADCGEESSQ